MDEPPGRRHASSFRRPGSSRTTTELNNGAPIFSGGRSLLRFPPEPAGIDARGLRNFVAVRLTAAVAVGQRDPERLEGDSVRCP